MITDQEIMEGETAVVDAEIEIEIENETETDALELEAGETSENNEEKPLKVHLDKWLWAARFYKTLPLARKAIQNGKIYYNGYRSRSSVEISVGGLLKIQHGNMDKLVIILGLSTRRRSMKDAAALYQDISQHQEALSRGGIAGSAMQSRYSHSQGSSQNGYGHREPGYSHGASHSQGSRDYFQGHQNHQNHQGQGYYSNHSNQAYQGHQNQYGHGQSGHFRHPYQRQSQSYSSTSQYEDRDNDYQNRGPSLLEEQQREKPKRIIRFLRRPLQKPVGAPIVKEEPETVDVD